MKHLPKSVWITAGIGLLLLLMGDLYNSIGFLVCVLGCCLLLYAWLCGLFALGCVKHPKMQRTIKVVKAFTFSAIAVFLLSFLWIEGMILLHDDGTEAPQAQTLIVLGAGLNGEQPSLTLIARMKTALEYLETHPQAVAIVTGGQGAGESITEAQAMARWLVARGVDASRLYLEEQATDTRENLRFSKAIAEQEGLPIPVAIVSSSFHLYRAQRLALQEGLGTVETIAAPVPDVPLQWLSVSVYLREYCSIVLMFLRNLV